MKSRITIEVDFEKGNLPIIKVLQRQSSDIRDSLLQNFLQSLDHSSRWCRIEYKGNTPISSESGVHDASYQHYWHVSPIKPSELKSEISLMNALIHDNEPEMVNVYGNSIAFREFLDKEGIQWKPNEQYTLIDYQGELFELGMRWQKYINENKPK